MYDIFLTSCIAFLIFSLAPFFSDLTHPSFFPYHFSNGSYDFQPEGSKRDFKLVNSSGVCFQVDFSRILDLFYVFNVEVSV